MIGVHHIPYLYRPQQTKQTDLYMYICQNAEDKHKIDLSKNKMVRNSFFGKYKGIVVHQTYSAKAEVLYLRNLVLSSYAPQFYILDLRYFICGLVALLLDMENFGFGRVFINLK